MSTTIKTIEQLKKAAYLLRNGEILTHPTCKWKTSDFSYYGHHKVFRAKGSTLVFFDECGSANVIPIPGNGNALKQLEQVLMADGYLNQATLYVPLSNGFDYPERVQEWNDIKANISRMFAE